jgi:hypothetical protein
VRCGIVLHVSLTYLRVLGVLSVLIGYSLVWAVRIHGIFAFCLCALPAAFVVASVMVRVAPHVVAPVFVLRHADYITALRLTDGSEEDSNADDRR